MEKIIGAFEKVNFPEFGLEGLVAKVDSGAFSGALHATYIHEVDLPTGEKALSFYPFGQRPKAVVAGFQKRLVRSSNGTASMRYIISTTVEIQGVKYPIQISLADRSDMKKGVLLGRRFLRSHGFLIDLNKGFEHLRPRKKAKT